MPFQKGLARVFWLWYFLDDMKIKKKTLAISFVVLLVLSAVSAVLIVKGQKTVKRGLLKVMSEHVDLQVKDVVYTDVGESGEKWEVRAKEARYMKSDNLAIFDNVRATLIMADGKTMTLTGDEGRLRTDTRDIEIKGNVIAVSANGDRFLTDQLGYSREKQEVFTDKAVTMESGGIRIKGKGMVLSLRDHTVKLHSEVNAHIN
jgi:LPS export ABC transporter protein LptC